MRPVTVTVGPNSASFPAYSGWVRFDDYAPGLVSIQCTVSGTVNYTVETTMDDPNSPTNPVAAASTTWLPSTDTNVVGATASKTSFFQYAPIFARVSLASGSGSVTATFLQSSNGPI
jgi:hypothetical protein